MAIQKPTWKKRPEEVASFVALTKIDYREDRLTYIAQTLISQLRIYLLINDIDVRQVRGALYVGEDKIFSTEAGLVLDETHKIQLTASQRKFVSSITNSLYVIQSDIGKLARTRAEAIDAEKKREHPQMPEKVLEDKDMGAEWTKSPGDPR